MKMALEPTQQHAIVHILGESIQPRKLLFLALPPLIVLFLFLAAWQLYVYWGDVNTLILPGPLQVASVTKENWPTLRSALMTTLTETIVGFGWAFAFGLGSATLLDLFLPIRRGFYPLLVASQSIPIVALAPLIQFWFGTEMTSKVIVITLSCFFPITVAGLDGLRTTDPEMIRLYRGFGANAWRIFWSVRLPNALPSLFSGIRISISYSVIAAIFSEYIGSQNGLGFFIQRSYHVFRIDLVIGAIAVTAAVSIALFLMVSLLERIIIPWFYAERHSKHTEE
jgi:ABC-type nitrate/sulfonate/bicarbonate transport system permease component